MTARGSRRARRPARRPAPPTPPTFGEEIRAAVRGERALVLKALVALMLAAGILLAHLYLFS